MQEAHEPREVIPKLVDLVKLLWVFAAETQEVAESVEPLAADLLKQSYAFPESRVCLVAPEDDKKAKYKRETRPDGTNTLHFQVVVTLFFAPMAVEQNCNKGARD